MKEKVLAELNNLLNDSKASTIAVLNKAILLAEATNANDYRALFIYHLNGITKEQSVKLNQDNPKLLSKFSSDRMKSGENFYLLGSVAFLERSLENSKRDVERAINTLEDFKSGKTNPPLGIPRNIQEGILGSAIGVNRTQQVQFEEILFKIRNRVASFVRSEEKKLFEIPKEEINDEVKEKRIFIGHGRSHIWRDLKDFLQDRLNLQWDEFNRESTAGLATKERLEDMLHDASFAFLVMTGEDEHADQSLHARENVIHEIGLFQGKLGFRKAIVLLEEGCKEFSNIIGLTQIRFPKGNIEAKFEEIRRVLERERILEVKR